MSLSLSLSVPTYPLPGVPGTRCWLGTRGTPGTGDHWHASDEAIMMMRGICWFQLRKKRVSNGLNCRSSTAPSTQTSTRCFL
eukprot:2610288-Rhodomonas_salina.2